MHLQAMPTKARPNLLRRVNERVAFELIRRHGPTSRPELKRRMGVTAPTVSKAVASLVRAGLLEEVGVTPQRDARAGRPFAMYRLASGSARVIGAMVAVRQCTVVAAGLDGVIDETNTVRFNTPATYPALLEALARAAAALGLPPAPCRSRGSRAALPSRGPSRRGGPSTFGMGISVPGEIDTATGYVLFSPNLHMLNGKSPAEDLASRLGIPAVLVHDTVASALAEQQHGAARDLSDFVHIGIYEGFGVSVMTGGRLLEGSRGLAGELGHITVERDGQRCGCGNRGCLETVATDAAFARLVGKRVGKKLEVEEIVARAASGDLDVRAELDQTLDWLAVGLAAAINLFNPQAILLTSRMLDADPRAFDRLKAMTAAHALKAMADDCRILRVRENVRQGVVAAIISHLTHSLGPAVG